MDLKKEINNLINEYWMEEYAADEFEEKLLKLFDSYTRSVIGEDENVYTSDQEISAYARNNLRAEQRSNLSPRGKEKK